ncbi:MAG: hypothetical protein JWR33_2438 [Naasia sp.]|jgi:transglutaminase-like putative cysteine protease|uniref:transglutaminase family protein n=1 Tax=Naasia sp. TaxID=2546198 RepID=UPI002606A38C|nr:DUF3488 and transglutaminase-like domain-containing protein [Naasia sp.]MCU1571697.1 hypothetical protein [Naasia sp.]
MSGTRGRPVEGRSTWGITAAALLATIVAAGSLRTLIQGDSWWWTALFVSVLALAASAGVRAIRRIAGLAPLAGLVATVVALLLLWVPGTLAWAILPTERTFPALEGLIRAALRQIYLDTPPATSTDGLRLMVAGGVALLAVVIDGLVAGARLPWLAGVPLLVLAIVPGRAVDRGDDLLGVTGSVLAFLLLVWLDRRRDLARPPASSAAALAATAVVGALLVQAFVPAMLDRSPASASTLRPVFSPGADPLLRLGEHLRQGADLVALTYRTTASRPVYLRVVTIDDLSGDDWTPALPDGGRADYRGLADFPSPHGLADDVQRDEVVTRVSDASGQRRWLPVPYPATSIEGLGAEWVWQPESLTVGSLKQASTVGEYAISSLQLDPTVDQLRAAGDVPPGFERYLALPDDLPAIISDTAATVTADAETPYDQAVALQAYLRSTQFEYDEETPARAADGDSFDVLATFLEAKTGYCVHFASAMAVLARDLGIPARIAVGYQPGDRRIGEAGVFEVTTHDLHAWPELYFEGVGWTRFEPTPGRGDVPRFRAGDIPSDNTPEPTASPSASTTPERTREEEAAAAAAAGGSGGPPLGGLLIGGATALVLLSPAGARVLRRRRRVGASGRVPAGRAWDELQDTALDLGFLEQGALTPRSFAGRLGDTIGASDTDRTDIDRLLAAVERERFDRPERRGDGVDGVLVRSLLARMSSSRGRLARIRAVLAPRSLLVRATSSRLASSFVRPRRPEPGRL